MKPILINLNEMSDSREVYESKPNIVLSIFIYAILVLFITALLWMYFGRIDVVVKSEGMLRPNDQVATVMNTYSGTLQQVNVKDGSKVKEGDTLYIIEHGDLLTEISYYQEQLKDAEAKLDVITRYKQSIEDGINYLDKSEQEEEYYLKYQAYELNYKKLKKGNETSEEQLKTMQTKLSNTQKLKKAVETDKNLFTLSGEEKEYYNLFLKYQSDYQSIVTQYINSKVEIDRSTTQEGLVNSLDYYQNMLDGLKQLLTSINNTESAFDGTSSYSLQYDQYVNKIASLESAYEQAKENYEINQELEGLAVTELEVTQSKASMEEAQRAIDAYKTDFLSNITSNITEAENKINELELSNKSTESKEELYQKNETEKEAALENYKLKYLVELDNTITTLKENIVSLKSNSDGLSLLDNSSLKANLEQYKNSELQTVIKDIDIYSDQIDELKANIEKLNSQISDTIVKASKTGVVNSNVELVAGDELSSGTQVLTIIPEKNSEYKVSIYVSNEDIGKLKEGMDVKFNIYALPQSEYGYLTGTITSISKDLKVDSSSGSGYYLVEAKVNNKTLYDAQGNKGVLKAGMTCQAQMITDQKRILTYLLEKLNLWINN
jgi:HlyD family secretion protein